MAVCPTGQTNNKQSQYKNGWTSVVQLLYFLLFLSFLSSWRLGTFYLPSSGLGMLYLPSPGLGMSYSPSSGLGMSHSPCTG